MSYLLDLVKSFDAEELNAFRKLDLKGNEEVIRDIYANHGASLQFDEVALPKKLSVTQSYFDKITSILLDKTIGKLYGDDYNRILMVIHNKALSGLALHELKIAERRILKSGNKKAVTDFYKVAFDFCRRMYHPTYNSKLTHAYGNKYLQSLGKAKTVAEESMVANLTFHADAIEQNLSGQEAAYKARAERHVKLWRGKTSGSKNAIAIFYTAFAHGSYYKYFTEDAIGYTAVIEEAHDIYKKFPDKIPSIFNGTLLCELGFAYLTLNRFKEAQASYAFAVKECPETIGKNIYHLGNYALCAVMNKDFTTANKIFSEVIWPKTSSNINKSVKFDIYTVACIINLHQQKHQEAYKYITWMLEYKKNEITLTGQLIVRKFQALYFVMDGDYATADTLVKKNLRYIDRQLDGATLLYYRGYMEALSKIIKHKTGSLQQIEKLRLQIDGLQGGMFMLYNALLLPLLGKSYSR